MPERQSPLPPITFECMYETDDPEVHQMEVGYVHSSGAPRTMLVRPSVKFKPSELRDRLADADALGIEQATMENIVAVIGGQPKSRKRITAVTGWHTVEQRDYFVLPRKTVGHIAEPPIVHEKSRGGTAPQDGAAGKFKRWRKAIRQVSAFSSYHVFAAAAALTGPLLRSFTPATGLVFNFSGHSGSGKTTLLYVAQSALRRTMEKGDLAKLAVTETALEELAASHNDLTLCIDEWGAIVGTPAAASSIVLALSYRLRDGTGKARSKQGNTSLGYDTNLSWRIVALTSSEEPLEHLTGRPRYPGEQVRFIEIHVPDREEGGVWDLAAIDVAAAHERTTRLHTALAQNYGLALPRFARRLAANPIKYGKIATEAVEEFVNRLQGDGAIANEQRRHAEAFGKVYATAVVASLLKVLPFSRKQAMLAVLAMHAQSELARNAGEDNLKNICRELLALAEDRERCKPSSPKIENGEGKVVAITKTLDGHEVVAIPTKRFAEVLGKRAKSLIPALRTRDILLPEVDRPDGTKGNDARQISAEGLVRDERRPRFFVFRLDRLRGNIMS